MFTGIITHTGTCIKRTSRGLQLQGPEEFLSNLLIGSSVSVNGVCLTVTALDVSSFAVDVMDETWQRTALSKLQVGDKVNFELALVASGRFDGHIVQGHIDGTGNIVAIKQSTNSHLYSISTSPSLLGYMIEKGSVAVNGISLTIISVTTKDFSVGIIPHTYLHTTMQQAAIGDVVNIEVDSMAKYVMKFIKEQHYERLAE